MRDSELCSVQTLKVYLDRTSQHKDGGLFWNITSSLPLKASGVRAAMVAVIKTSNTENIPTAHDVRKIVSSCNFLNNMSFSSLASYTGWRGKGVFFRHYNKWIDVLPHLFVSAGVISRPAENVQDL